MANFFQSQEEARRRTRYLVFLFHVIVFITALTTAFFYLLYMHLSHPYWYEGLSLGQLLIHRETLFVFATVYFMVWGVAIIRRAPLKRGGASIAQLAGGREVQWGTHDLTEKTLINIVEEMGIASGVPLPRVFVLDNEIAINAFAAGITTHDACVAVSRGALEKLTREELQGVIAHEFSHILNGDMKLNIHLLGYLYGLTSIADAGRMLMRSSSSGSSRNRKNNGAGIGVGLFLIGALGYFFAFILKAAVSRDRERLADASAVQFTRNPQGIGGALRKIWRESLSMTAPRATEISHFYFHWPTSFLSFLSTHPPLIERLKALGVETADVSETRNPLPAQSHEAISSLAPEAQDITPVDPTKLLSAFYFWLEGAPSLGLSKSHRPELLEQVKKMNDQERFVALERALVSMKGESISVRQAFLKEMKGIIEEDRQISPREFLFYRTLQIELSPPKYKSRVISDRELWPAVEIIAAFFGQMFKQKKEDEFVLMVLQPLGRVPQRVRAANMAQLHDAMETMALGRLVYRPRIFDALKMAFKNNSTNKTEIDLAIKLVGLILEVPKMRG